VLSGVPRVVCQVHCYFYIVDIFCENLTVKLYADDVKIHSVIDNVGKTLELQQGLTTLSDWCSKWQMKINVQKCSVLTIGRACSSHLFFTDNVFTMCEESEGSRCTW